MAQLTESVKPAESRRHSAPPRTARRRKVRAGGAGKQHDGGPIAYLFLILAALVSLFPLYWTVVAASHTDTDIVTPPTPLLPGSHLIDNLKIVWEQVDMTKALVNSTIVAGFVSVSTVLFATLAGFA